MPRWGPTCQAQNAHRDRARMHTPRAPPQHGGRGRPGAVAGDRREGAREGVGFLPSGDGRPAAGIDDDVAGATSAAARTETPWAAVAWRRAERPESVRVAAAAWRRAATARNGGVEQRRRRPEISAAPPHSKALRARRCARGGEEAGSYTAKTHRSRAVATPGTYDSLFPGVSTARDL